MAYTRLVATSHVILQQGSYRPMSEQMMHSSFFVHVVETLKRIFHARTWQVESLFVFACLASVAIIRIVVTGHGWVEWIGVLAVWGTFAHASIANRLEEKEAKRILQTGKSEVECYRKMSRYFMLKESAWFMYFVLIGAYSALVGVVIFLAYGRWRTLWRTYHPL